MLYGLIFPSPEDEDPEVVADMNKIEKPSSRSDEVPSVESDVIANISLKIIYTKMAADLHGDLKLEVARMMGEFWWTQI